MFVIADGHLKKTGLKTTDITAEFDRMISDAKDFILISGYSFTRPKNVNSVLNKIIKSKVKHKHCILPIKLFGNKDVNRPIAIELIKNGISVSIEEHNHSKWLMTDKEIYYGSANFSLHSLSSKIEVISFKDFLKGDLLQKEFLKFTEQSMNRMKSISLRNNVRGVIVKNKKLIDQTKPLVKRFNPSIEKVISTVDSINKVNSNILEVASNNFWFLEEKEYDNLVRTVASYSSLIQSINYFGTSILRLNEIGKDYDKKIESYNRYCDKFQNLFSEYLPITENLLNKESKIPEFTRENRQITSKNIVMLKENWL